MAYSDAGPLYVSLIVADYRLRCVYVTLASGTELQVTILQDPIRCASHWYIVNDIINAVISTAKLFQKLGREKGISGLHDELLIADSYIDGTAT